MLSRAARSFERLVVGAGPQEPLPGARHAPAARWLYLPVHRLPVLDTSNVAGDLKPDHGPLRAAPVHCGRDVARESPAVLVGATSHGCEKSAPSGGSVGGARARPARGRPYPTHR